MALKSREWLARFAAERDGAELFELAKRPPSSGVKTRPAVVRGLEVQVRSHPEIGGRLAAAYAVGFSCDASACPTLVEVMEDEVEDIEVRAGAAEGLGYLMRWRDRRTHAFRWVASRLIGALSHDSVHLRFWGAFALGTMRARQAIPALTALTHDTRMMPGWWRVSDEAGDALHVIAGGMFPDRERQVRGS